MVIRMLKELSENYKKLHGSYKELYGSYEELTGNHTSMKKYIETVNKSQKEMKNANLK